jgi:hypothetical protein
VVFVPRQPLAVATLYSVTLGAGVGVEGSDQTLAEDFVFQFETGAEKRGEEPAPSLQFSRTVSESPTSEPPVLSLFRSYYGPEQPPAVEALSFRAYRFPDVNAFLDSLARFDAIPSWASQARSAFARRRRPGGGGVFSGHAGAGH